MIGILTFQNTVNYGAMLQVYALTQKISSMGGDCEVINYICDEIKKNEYPLKISDVNSVRKLLHFLFTNNYAKIRFSKFQNFYIRYINSSDREYNKTNISEAEKDYDKIIVGSDQIWNLELSGNDYTYFLDFVEEDSKKYTYAASFGYSEIHGDENKQRYFLSKFQQLNVREMSGANIIKKLLGINCNIVLDPTLLMKRNEWDRIIGKRIISRDYVVVYLINRDANNFKFIRKFAKKHKLKIIYIHNYLKGEKGMDNARTIGPVEFLNYIKFASYVFTGSFHAICLSLIYHKEFYFTLSNKHNRNSRLIDLIKMLEIKDRQFLKKNFILDNRIDYDSVDAILERKRKFSLSILKSILG